MEKEATKLEVNIIFLIHNNFPLKIKSAKSMKYGNIHTFCTLTSLTDCIIL